MPLLEIEAARELVHLLVKAGSAWDVKVAAPVEHRLSCSFAVEGAGDIEFEALFVEGAALADDVYKASAKRPPDVLEPPTRCRHGSLVYQARGAGVVLLRLCNQHSWTRSKSVQLSVERRALPREPAGGAPGGAALLSPRAALEEKMNSWLATIPIGVGGAEGGTSHRVYEPAPLVEFAMREGLEQEGADEIYRLYVERQVADAEEEMVLQGLIDVEPDAELVALAEYCAALSEDELRSRSDPPPPFDQSLSRWAAFSHSDASAARGATSSVGSPQRWRRTPPSSSGRCTASAGTGWAPGSRASHRRRGCGRSARPARPGPCRRTV